MKPTPQALRAAEAIFSALRNGGASINDFAAIIDREFATERKLLDEADELLSIGDLLVDGCPGAREWHDKYTQLPTPPTE